ncbi:MAG: hypothetical protein MRY78_10390 [Saprospiraceae bacterium]|nr:hypothetical protein [Saprospiraceae bacterium]
MRERIRKLIFILAALYAGYQFLIIMDTVIFEQKEIAYNGIAHLLKPLVQFAIAAFFILLTARPATN